MSSFISSKKYTGVSYKTLINDDRSYYVSYKLAGKFKRVHIGKRSEGIDEPFCHQKRSEIINGLKFGNEVPIIKHKKKKVATLNEVAEIYFKEKEAENSANKKQWGRYNLHIKETLGEEDVTVITRDDILSLRDNLVKNDKAPKTVNGILQLLSAIINHSIKYKKLSITNPCSSVPKLKVDDERERFLTLDEIKELQYAVRRDSTLLTFVNLSLSTGARLQSVLNIQKKDIDLDNDTVTIKDLKNNSTYRGFLNKGIKDLLIPIMSELKANSYIVGASESIYPSRTLQRHLQKDINDLFNDNLDSKDSKNRVVIHTLRHTFASHLAINGTPIFTIQKLMNHADIKQTMRYAKLAPDSGKNNVFGLYE